MQRVDGVTLFRRLKADSATRDIAVIFFTAFGAEVQQRVPNYRELGVQLLPKPCPIDHIRQVVTTAVAAHDTRPQRARAAAC